MTVEHLTTDPEPWRDKAFIAEHLGISVREVDRKVTEGMPCHRLGRNGHRRFRVTEVDAWVEEHGGEAA
jgi:excisionase family DNA binding protein